MIPAVNGGFEVKCPGDQADLVNAELLVLDFGRDANAWVSAASYAVCAGEDDAFAPVLAKRLLAMYPLCRDRDGNEQVLFGIFGGPPEASEPFEVLRRLAAKAPAAPVTTDNRRKARDGGPPTV
jgi:hypothetical protein